MSQAQPRALTHPSIVENFIVIICACMPAVASFAKHRLGSLTTIIPSFGSRMLRSRTRKSKPSSRSSGEASSSIQETKGASMASYDDLHDTAPLNHIPHPTYPAVITVSSTPAPLSGDERIGIRKQQEVEQ